MRSMGEVRVHATEKVCALKHPFTQPFPQRGRGA